jgi:methionyl-tRNA synthetase
LAAQFGLSFDHYGRSSHRKTALTQHFAGVLADKGLIEERVETQMYSHEDGHCRIAILRAPAQLRL